MKSSIREVGARDQSGVYAQRVLGLTLGALPAPRSVAAPSSAWVCHASIGAPPADCIHRTAGEVTRLSGGVGGERSRGLPLSRLAFSQLPTNKGPEVADLRGGSRSIE